MTASMYRIARFDPLTTGSIQKPRTVIDATMAILAGTPLQAAFAESSSRNERCIQEPLPRCSRERSKAGAKLYEMSSRNIGDEQHPADSAGCSHLDISVTRK